MQTMDVAVACVANNHAMHTCPSRYCYSYLFYTTAGCMFLSQIPFWLMLELVPVKEDKNL